MFTRHLQGSHLLKARTCPSSVKRSLYKCSWIFIAIGYVHVCRVYTFITLPVSSVSNNQDMDWTAEVTSHGRISDSSITCYMFRLYSVNNTNYFSFLLSLNISHIRLFCSVPCTFISVREIYIGYRVVLVRPVKFFPLFWVARYRPTDPSVSSSVQYTDL